RAPLEDERDLGGEESGAGPPETHPGAGDTRVSPGGEHPAQRAEEGAGLRDRALQGQGRGRRAGVKGGPPGWAVWGRAADGRVGAEGGGQAADAADGRGRQRPELERRGELEREDDQDRVALTALGEPRRQQADCSEGEPAEVELQPARVLLLLAVEEEEAAAA